MPFKWGDACIGGLQRNEPRGKEKRSRSNAVESFRDSNDESMQFSKARSSIPMPMIKSASMMKCLDNALPSILENEHFLQCQNDKNANILSKLHFIINLQGLCKGHSLQKCICASLDEECVTDYSFKDMFPCVRMSTNKSDTKVNSSFTTEQMDASDKLIIANDYQRIFPIAIDVNPIYND